MEKEEKYGIKNLKIIVLAICQLQLLQQQIFAKDKGNWFSVIFKFIRILIPNFKIYLSFNYKLVDDEIKDASPDEITELVAFISTKLKIKDKKKLLDFIKSSIDLASKGFILFS